MSVKKILKYLLVIFCLTSGAFVCSLLFQNYLDSNTLNNTNTNNSTSNNEYDDNTSEEIRDYYKNTSPRFLIENLITTFYLNENINLDNVTMSYYEDVDGEMVKKRVPITLDMISEFDTTTTGTKQLKITYNDHVHNITYHVIEKNEEKVTSDSFTLGKYYPVDTVVYTPHFTINIESGCYIGDNYITMIETIYSIQEKVSGLEFKDKYNIEVLNKVHPGCSAFDLYINESAFFSVSGSSGAFLHELAHGLNFSQVVGLLPTHTLVEGFATYIEYLTAKEIRDNYPKLYPYIESVESILSSCSFLNSKMYSYDFETKILNLKRDELAGNSQYEAGARFFAYLDHRYGDFCGWMKDERFKTQDVKIWIDLIKVYYDNEKIFDEFYPYEQSLSNVCFVLCGAEDVIFQNISSIGFIAVEDFSLTNKLNYHLNFNSIYEAQGWQQFCYKDLYLNIESVRYQLGVSYIYYKNLKMETSKDVTIELYNSRGEIMKTITNTSTAFSLDNVSFIKLVGSGSVDMNVFYTEL